MKEGAWTMSATIEIMTLINLFLMLVVLGLTATAIATLLFGMLSAHLADDRQAH
jgi:hypothetical protein